MDNTDKLRQRIARLERLLTSLASRVDRQDDRLDVVEEGVADHDETLQTIDDKLGLGLYEDEEPDTINDAINSDETDAIITAPDDINENEKDTQHGTQE